MAKESKIKDGNFYVIQSFMLKDLKLKGNELTIYAIIYGFSQIENQWFTGSIQYLADWCNAKSKNTILKSLKNLVERKLIIKEETLINNVKFCKYRANMGYIKNCYTGANNSMEGIAKIDMGGISKNEPNNININNISNNNININKNKYGTFQNVLLTNEELEKLKARFPDWHARIEKLSCYIESKGAKYKSHYATILSWANSEIKKQQKAVNNNERNKNIISEYPD